MTIDLVSMPVSAGPKDRDVKLGCAVLDEALASVSSVSTYYLSTFHEFTELIIMGTMVTLIIAKQIAQK